jgi:dTDP-4-amino-4,6-dideoxygalactose transaminase
MLPGAPASATARDAGKPALLGGTPTRRSAFPSWPVRGSIDRDAVVGVLESGNWFRGASPSSAVSRFESAYAAMLGAKHCVATANGTSALIAALGALGVGPGDEVIVPPYTFVATVNAVLMHHAVPIFVDTDPNTFQMDATKLEAAITDRTAAIVPVHLGGNVCDLDTVLDVAARRKLPVVEDACQAHLAEWRGRKVGTLGTSGAFSFQVTKNLPSGEGGAVVTDDPDLAESVYAFHNNGRGRGAAGYSVATRSARAANLRMTEFQGALLQAQMTRIEAQSRTREDNAAYLTEQLSAIDGLRPAARHAGCTRNAYHLYMFRYDPAGFAGLPRDRFIEAIAAEGIPASSGYTPLNSQPFLKETLATKGYQRIYPADYLNSWSERNACPANDALCEQAVWFTQTMLLGPRADMDQIADAIRKVSAHAGELARSHGVGRRGPS